MNYEYTFLSEINKELHEFIKNPTKETIVNVLFHPPPHNQSIYMCIIQRRKEGFLKSECYDLFLQCEGSFIHFELII